MSDTPVTHEDEPTRRKQWYVSRLIQGRLLVRLAGYWIVYHAVLLGAMFLFQLVQYRGMQLAGLPPRTFLELLVEFASSCTPLLLSALCVLPLVLWDAVRTTHRVAGPLVRFQNALRALSRGQKVERIELRDGDLVVELQDAFNEYLDALEGRLADTVHAIETPTGFDPVRVSARPAGRRPSAGTTP